MTSVRMCVASLLRRRVVGMVVLALLVAVAGAAVLAAFAGARRTESAYPRLLDRTGALDVLVAPGFGEAVPASTLRRIPGVAVAGDAYGFGISAWSGRGPKPDNFPASLGALATSPSIAHLRAEEPQVSEGRLPRADRADEIFLNESAAARYGLHAGSVAHFSLYDYADLINDDGTVNPDAPFLPLTFRVVGIGRTLDDLLTNENQDVESAMLSPAFVNEYRDHITYSVAGVQLRRGTAGIPAFTDRLERVLGDERVDLQTRVTRERAFAQVTEPYATALVVFAIAAAIAGAIVVAQAFVRMVQLDAAESGTLRALGMARRTRATSAAGRALGSLVLGAAGAVALAIALSPLFPLGRARLAEPDPGLRVDAVVLAIGVVVIVAVLAIPIALSAWTAVRPRQEYDAPDDPRASGLAARLARAGAPAPVVTGVRFAFQDAAGRRTSILATLAGLSVAIATVIAALTFGTSLDRMITTPARYGWTWDVLVDTADAGAPPEMIAALRSDDRAAGLTIGTRGNVAFSGLPVTAYAFERVRGDARPVASAGHMPRRADEVAIGAQSLDRLGARVGGTVEAQRPDGSIARYRVVGRTALPSLALNGVDGLGDGVAMTVRGLARVDPTASASFFLVDRAAGVTTAALQHDYGDAAAVSGPQRPGAIRTYRDVRTTPLLLASLLAVLGFGVLVHLLVTSVRGRRRTLAVLKTLGFTRRQIAATVSAQATTLVTIALLAGVPVGLVVGRWTWSRFADDLGVVAGVVIPGAALLVVVVTVLVIGNLAAVLPARSAARTPAGVVLRTE